MAEYSEQIKAQALALIIAGQSFSEVSRALHVPVGTLKSWKQRNADVADSVFMDAPDASTASAKKERIGALLLDYLVTTLETLKAQQVAFRDLAWLEKQSAAELAVLHGVSFDKALRLLEGLADDAPNDS